MRNNFTDTALLILDVQNGWAFDTYDCYAVFDNINLLAGRARAADIPVIYVCDYTNPEAGRYTPWELEIVEAIAPDSKDMIIGKEYVRDVLDETTRVEEVLKKKKVGFLVVCGMTSGACVNGTSLGALQRGYGLIIPSDGHSIDTVRGIYKKSPVEVIKDFNTSWAELGAIVMQARDIYF